MSNTKHPRKCLFVDPKVQNALITRVVLYWMVCLTGMALILLCWRVITGPPQPFIMHFNELWFYYGPAVIASLILLPLVIFDLVRFSNRFVGPLFRLRRSMRELARGQYVEPLEFRDADFWGGIAEEFNAVRIRLQGCASASEDQTEEEEEQELTAVG